MTELPSKNEDQALHKVMTSEKDSVEQAVELLLTTGVFGVLDRCLDAGMPHEHLKTILKQYGYNTVRQLTDPDCQLFINDLNAWMEKNDVR